MSDEQNRDGLVGEVIDQRVQVYGNPTETFIRIAQVWSGILGHEVNPTDVPLCLIGMKIVRTTQAPDYSDNSDDIEGYLDIFRQLVGPDMIQARSVTEYVEKKGRRTCPRCGGPWGEDLTCENCTTEDGEPIPFTLAVPDRVQHLRRAKVVMFCGDETPHDAHRVGSETSCPGWPT